jgi:hypothetical protein
LRQVIHFAGVRGFGEIHPEDVIRRITDYRATDKHDPAYYARHTVEKAQAAINSKRRDVQSQPEASGHSAPVRE